MADHVLLRWFAAAVMVAAATGLSSVAWPLLAAADVVMLYLIAVVVASAALGRGSALVASVASVAAYNFFFVPPYHTFHVADGRNLLSFGVLFGAGLLMSSLVERLRAGEQRAREQADHLRDLYELSSRLATARDEEAVARVAAVGLEAMLGVPVAVWVLREGQTPLTLAAEVDGVLQDVVGRSIATAETAQSASGAIAIPIAAGGPVLGVVGLRALAPGQLEAARAGAVQVALALQRARVETLARTADLRARTEEVRSALLSTVSHDLRTPLAAIVGGATTLRSAPNLPRTEQEELLDAIRDEAERMEQLVGNLLDMTRLSSGVVVVAREWVPMDEIVGTALARVGEELAERELVTAVDPGLPLLSVDPLLLQQALVNLLRNAIRHSPASGAITVRAARDHDGVVLSVEDRGDGLPPGDPARLFEPFVRGPSASGGSGLGLAICRGVALAHGGSIDATPRSGGGAVFSLHLPVVGSPPAVPAMDDL